jgi:UDP-N-acetylglucosamine--N-acetylmuramyl-(pentapeptide) pyrophosphoryl-undecaprenol N-acetylglucosamine transferase
MKKTTQGQLHVVIACGGTGGHLFPGIAVGETLAARGHDVTLIISEKKIDSLAASGHTNLHFERMPFHAMPRPWSPKMLPFLIGTWKGLKRCRQIIRDHHADAVLGMGGFTSLTPIYAGRKEGCKTLIHDSNAIPGKANKLTAKFCDVVLLGLGPCKSHFPKHPDVRVVGTPVRTSMKQAVKDDPYEFFKLDRNKKTLVVMGGSQGAQGINRLIEQCLDTFEKIGIQILHIAGPSDYEAVRDVYARHPMLSQHVAAFCHRMELAYKIADLAVARSGASTLTELSHFGVPSLLIPYPFAADDHQTRNAEIFANAGAAIMLRQESINTTAFADTVRELLVTAPKKNALMKAAAQKLATPDSAERIADIIEQQTREKRTA